MYTYFVPEELVASIQFGIRVEVQLGKSKLYSGLVIDIHQNVPEDYMPKPIVSIIDQQPIIYTEQFDLWLWMAKYYGCSIGEVMNAALPTGLKLSSETTVVLGPMYDPNFQGLDDKEFMICEALSIQNELTTGDIQKILNQKTVYPLIQRMINKKIIYLKEELKKKYKPKIVVCVRLQEPYLSNPELLQEAFDKLSRSTRQVEALMAYVQLSRNQKVIRRAELGKKANVDSSVLNAMAKKKIFEFYDKEISRIGSYQEDLQDTFDLSAQQVTALSELRTHFENKNVALLHGVTGSGKTRVYVELIQEAIQLSLIHI